MLYGAQRTAVAFVVRRCCLLLGMLLTLDWLLQSQLGERTRLVCDVTHAQLHGFPVRSCGH